jgi:hypothetical protein
MWMASVTAACMDETQLDPFTGPEEGMEGANHRRRAEPRE